MTRMNTKLTAAIETYLADLRRVSASGGATGERSNYGPDLFPVSFPGVKTSHDGFLVDVDLGRLKVRVCPMPLVFKQVSDYRS